MGGKSVHQSQLTDSAVLILLGGTSWQSHGPCDRGKRCSACKRPCLCSALNAGMVASDFGIKRFGLEAFIRLRSCLGSLGFESEGRRVFLFLPFKCHFYDGQS